jgi:hypothetical protein
MGTRTDPGPIRLATLNLEDGQSRVTWFRTQQTYWERNEALGLPCVQEQVMLDNLDYQNYRHEEKYSLGHSIYALIFAPSTS